MISEETVRITAETLLGRPQSDFPYAAMASWLSDAEERLGLELSAYGFLLWAVDHYGMKCAWRNVLASPKLVDAYAEAARKFRDDMPAMLVNANEYVTRLLSNVADMDVCFRQLEGMTFPYVLYVLFAGSGQRDIVDRYRVEAEEQLRRYPSTLDLLPDAFRRLKEELLNKDGDAQ